MSLTTQYIGGKQAIKRQKIALVLRLRRNFALKMISLATAVLLYLFVQQERNPTVPRVFEIPITYAGLPLDVSAESDQKVIKVTVQGPQPVVDALNDSAIAVVADLHALPGDRIATARVPMHYEVKLTREIQSLLLFDPPALPRLEVQSYPHRSHEFLVEAHYPHEARPGYRYGVAIIKPLKVTVSGRIDRVKRVTQVVADASSLEQGGGIDNSFTLHPRDADNNPVEGVTLDVQTARVTVPIQEEPYSKIISISPILNDQPQPGYRITRVSSSPNQIRIAGRPEQINSISTLQTGEIPVHDLMDNTTLSASLVIPRGIVVRDLEGNVITKVVISISVEKVGTAPPPPPGTTPGTSGP